VVQENLYGKPGILLCVGHGTPRRALVRMVMKLYEGNDLKEQSMPDLCHKAWKLAVITIEEDRNLNRLARSKMFSSPDERWRAAGISFTKTDRP
jgi:hypothetical protein